MPRHYSVPAEALSSPHWVRFAVRGGGGSPSSALCGGRGRARHASPLLRPVQGALRDPPVTGGGTGDQGQLGLGNVGVAVPATLAGYTGIRFPFCHWNRYATAAVFWPVLSN